MRNQNTNRWGVQVLALAAIAAVYPSSPASGQTAIGGKEVTKKALESIKRSVGGACQVPDPANPKANASCSAGCSDAIKAFVTAKDKEAENLIRKAFKGHNRSANPETAKAIFLPVIEQLVKDRDDARAKQFELQLAGMNAGKMDSVKRMLFHWLQNSSDLADRKKFESTLAGRIATQEATNYCYNQECGPANGAGCTNCISGALAQVRSQAGFVADQLSKAVGLLQESMIATAYVCPGGDDPALKHEGIAKYLKDVFRSAYGDANPDPSTLSDDPNRPSEAALKAIAYTKDPKNFAGAPFNSARPKATGAASAGGAGEGAAGTGQGGGGKSAAGDGGTGKGGAYGQNSESTRIAGKADKPASNGGATLQTNVRAPEKGDEKNVGKQHACLTEEDLKKDHCRKFGFKKRVAKCPVGQRCDDDGDFVLPRGKEDDCFGFLKEFGCTDKDGKPMVLGKAGQVLGAAMASAARDSALEEYGTFVARKKAANLFEISATLDEKALNDDAVFKKLVSKVTPSCLSGADRKMLEEDLGMRRKALQLKLQEASTLVKDGNVSKEAQKARDKKIAELVSGAQKAIRLESASSDLGRVWGELGCSNRHVNEKNGGVVRLDQNGASAHKDGGISQASKEQLAERLKLIRANLKDAYKGNSSEILVSKGNTYEIRCDHLFNLQRKAQEEFFETLKANPMLQAASKEEETVRVENCQIGGEYRTWGNLHSRMYRGVTGSSACVRSKTLADRIVTDKLDKKPGELDKQIKLATQFQVDEGIKAANEACIKNKRGRDQGRNGMDAMAENGYLSLADSSTLLEFMQCKDIGMVDARCQARHSWAPALCEASKEFKKDEEAQKAAGHLTDIASLTAGLSVAGFALLSAGPPGWALAAGLLAFTAGQASHEIHQSRASEDSYRRISSDFYGGVADAKRFKEAFDNFDGRNADFILGQMANLVGAGFDGKDLAKAIKAYRAAKKAGDLRKFRDFARAWHASEATKQQLEKVRRGVEKMEGKYAKGAAITFEGNLQRYLRVAEGMTPEEEQELINLYRLKAMDQMGTAALALGKEDLAAILSFEDVVKNAIKRGDLPEIEGRKLLQQAKNMAGCCVKINSPGKPPGSC